MRCASDKSTEPMEIISIAEPRGAAAGTMIMVATRRNAGERQSFDHLLVGDDLVGPRRQHAINAPDPERCLKVMVSRRERVVMRATVVRRAVLGRRYCCACVYRALFWSD